MSFRFYQIFPQSCGQQWRFYSSYAGRNNPSRAILHSRCSSHRWVEINYQHWLLCYWARSLRSSKLPSHCPYLHPKDPLEIVFLVQKALPLHEQPVFFSRNVTQSCIFSHGVFFLCVRGMGKYTYQYKGFRKNRLCLATSSKTSRMHLTKLALYNEIPTKAFST